MNMEIVRVQPTREDAELILRWRNDPLTLRMSYHQQPKDMTTFWEEFTTKYFVDETLPPLFGVVAGEKIGFLRHRRYEEPLPEGLAPACDVGTIVAPEQRGKGYSGLFMALGAAYIHQLGWKHIIAEVKPDNIPSIRMVERAGYQQLDVYQRVIHDLPEAVTVIRFVHKGE